MSRDSSGATMTEQWKPIPGFPFYEASDRGRIRTWLRNTPRVMKPIEHWDGYLYKKILNTVRRRVTISIQRLVCLAFHGEPKLKKMDASHRDGDKLNNVPGNIFWENHQANRPRKGEPYV